MKEEHLSAWVQTSYPDINRAKSLLLAASFAFITLIPAPAENASLVACIADHAVLVYERAGSSWVYDPCGGTTTFLGKIDIQCPRQLAQCLSPDATTGGWLISRDLAWLRRHGVAANESANTYLQTSPEQTYA